MAREEGFVEVTDGRVWYRREGERDAHAAPRPARRPRSRGRTTSSRSPSAWRLTGRRSSSTSSAAAARTSPTIPRCGRSTARLRGGRHGARGPGARALPPARPVLGRLALHRVHVPRRAGDRGSRARLDVGEHAGVHGRGARAHRRSSRAAPHDAAWSWARAASTTRPEYQAAVMEFYRRHLCRLDPWPECVLQSAAELDGNQVYLTMNGPTEFDVIGSLRDWDRTADLGRIRVADARHLRPLRRDHPRLLADHRATGSRRAHGRVRALGPLRARGGAGAVRGGRGGVPGLGRPRLIRP